MKLSSALIYYSPTLFQTMGLDHNLQLIMSGILNITQLVGVTTSVWSMDAIGRRPLLLGGSIVMTISHVIIAILVGKFSSNWPAHRSEGWTSVAFLFLYMLGKLIHPRRKLDVAGKVEPKSLSGFGASWGPVPWALPSETFPSSLRAKGVALSTCSNWLNNFVIVRYPS